MAASSELMHQLTAAASCLARFQQLTFTEQTQQAHAIAQAQMQTQNLVPHPHPNELPPVRPTLPPMHEAIQLPPSSTYAPSTSSHSSHSQSRQTTPPRPVLHPCRHQSQSDFHHSLSPTLPPPLHSGMHDWSHSHVSQVETPRQVTVPPSSGSSSTTTSGSTSKSSPVARRLTSRGRSNSYALYNEAESAWGYFDSRDLEAEEDEEEDELYAEEESPVVHSQNQRQHQRPHSRQHQHQHPQHSSQRSPPGRHTSVDGQGQQTQRHGGRSSSHATLSQRTSDMRSTTSSSGPEDTPMRMREDSPMRIR